MENKNPDKNYKQIISAVYTDKKDGGKYFTHFGIHEKTASIYGNKKEDIVNVQLELSDNQKIVDNNNDPNIDYWGWFDYTEKKFTSLIYPKYFLLGLCFAYGIKAAEDNNQGKAFRLNIKLYE